LSKPANITFKQNKKYLKIKVGPYPVIPTNPLLPGAGIVYVFLCFFSFLT
jgi:hypothetical protein